MPGLKLDDAWCINRIKSAIALRKRIFNRNTKPTTGFRLIYGEGDGLPGLVCDVYNKTAVLQADGEASEKFWNLDGIAKWLADTLKLNHVYQKYGRSGRKHGRDLFSSSSDDRVHFLENGHKFTIDLVKGQKTGFYLDQRENRQQIGRLAESNRVLNMFGYTGSFSVYAGLGGASKVTTVDSAKQALEVANDHWKLNHLPQDAHEIIASDAFDYLTRAIEEGLTWDLTILDPPSFARSEKALDRALPVYKRLIASGALVTTSGGILAISSCSSHVTLEDFLNVIEVGIAEARRKATILGVYGLPPDHPTPLVMPELRYLKFIVLRLDN
jgi:23S rRNA (cytosine1962-C5)-methyltransferase